MKNTITKNYFEVIRPGINSTFQDLGRKHLYHIGIPFEILRKGGLYFKLDWKHSRVIGLGEFINLIGLIIRTDNIGACLNFISLCFLLRVTYNYTSNKQINILLTLLYYCCMGIFFKKISQQSAAKYYDSLSRIT